MKKIFLTIWASCLFLVMAFAQEELTGFESNGKVGFKDQSGRVVIPAKYERGIASEGVVSLMLNGKWGVVDTKGNTVIPFKYDFIDGFKEGLARVELNGKYGFIDTRGSTVIPLRYDNAYGFKGDLAKVELDGKWGAIDINGKEIIPLKYDEIQREGFKNQVAVFINDRMGIINRQGKEIIPAIYDDALWFTDNLIVLGIGSATIRDSRGSFWKIGGRYALFDIETGKQLTELKYSDIIPNDGGSNSMEEKDKYFRVVIADEFEIADCCEKEMEKEASKRFDLNTTKGGVGLIDSQGKEIIPPIYDYVDNVFYEDLIRVIPSDSTVVVFYNRKTEKEVKYNLIEFLGDEDIFKVELNGRKFFIDKMGKEISR